ncbi:hypothetical protein AKG98_858 [Moritella sp. JT01]|uniref:hypothetical protein n=1 Tax=Moritella sp. JT01 TaxID=756698 RepID=UPI00079CCB49|nr:hypothetical protein [Moritella sp. JT01]KXO10075.1 hypothetical protein AKG98_858 [Moritella sp. JT01]
MMGNSASGLNRKQSNLVNKIEQAYNMMLAEFPFSTEALSKSLATIELDDLSEASKSFRQEEKVKVNRIFKYFKILKDCEDYFIKFNADENESSAHALKDRLMSDQNIVIRVTEIIREIDPKGKLNVSSLFNDLYNLYGEHIFALRDYLLTESTRRVEYQLRLLSDKQRSVMLLLKEKEDELSNSMRDSFNKSEMEMLDNVNEARKQSFIEISEREENFRKFISSTEKKHAEKISIQEKEIFELILNNKSEILEQMKTESDKVTGEFNDAFSSNLDSSKIKIEQHVSGFEESNNEIKKMLEATGSGLLANNNLCQAEKEKKSADRLRFGGTLILTCLILYTGFEVNELITKVDKINTMFLLVRFLLIFLVTMPGIYLLKESSRHRADERKYRKVGIQLATINAYLDSFSAEEKGKIKQDLTSNFFGDGDVKSDISTVPDMQKSIDKLLDTISSMAKK